MGGGGWGGVGKEASFLSIGFKVLTSFRVTTTLTLIMQKHNHLAVVQVSAL